MNKNQNIKSEVEKTLEILDHHNKIEVSPFFNTRLEAKIEKLSENQDLTLFSILKQRYLQPVLISSLLLVNVFVLVFTISNNIIKSNSRETKITNIIEFYEMDQSEYYILTSNEN